MHDEVILGVMEDDAGGYRVRTQADGVCSGILAPNYVGDDGATIETLDTSEGSFQLIPADFVAKGTKTASGMLLDKIAELLCRYRILHWKPGKGDDIVDAISPKQHMDLLLMEQTQSRDYGFSSLSKGQINDFLVVKFLITNMPPIDDAGNRLCVAWLKTCVKFGIWKEAAFRIEPRSEYIDVREQITVKAALGATASTTKWPSSCPTKKPPDEPEQQTDWKGTSETPAPHAGEAGVFHVGTRKDDFRKQSGSMKDKNSAARRHPRIPLRSSCRGERNGGRPLRPGNCRGNRKRSRATQLRRRTQNRLPELFESHPCGNRPKGGYKAGGKPLNRARQSPCKRAWSFPRLYSQVAAVARGQRNVLEETLRVRGPAGRDAAGFLPFQGACASRCQRDEPAVCHDARFRSG